MVLVAVQAVKIIMKNVITNDISLITRVLNTEMKKITLTTSAADCNTSLNRPNIVEYWAQVKSKFNFEENPRGIKGSIKHLLGR